MERKEQIIAMAKILQQGEHDVSTGKIDSSKYCWEDTLHLGLQRLAGAEALYNESYCRRDVVVHNIASEMKDAIMKKFSDRQMSDECSLMLSEVLDLIKNYE